MRYEITRLTLDAEATLPIDEGTFLEIRKARDSVFLLFRIEEDYDILVGNYLDLENTILSLGLKSFVQRRLERADFDADRRGINRMIMNLLSSARAFTDHTKYNVARLSGRKSSDAEFVSSLLPENQPSLSYRVAEALRNHSQHCGSATQGLTYGRRLIEFNGTEYEKLLSSVAPLLSISELKSDRKVDLELLKELDSPEGDGIAVMPHLRVYVESLSSVVSEVRRLYGDRVNAWFNTLDEWVGRYRAVTNTDMERNSISIAAVSLDESGGVLEEIALVVDIKKRLDCLQMANQRLINLHKLQIGS